jgi:hypothetical protein
MKTEKMPAMPMYVKDAYTDEWFRQLSFSEQGAFWFLAGWQWLEGSIPEFSELVAALPSKQRFELRQAWKRLEQKFPRADDGRRRNAKLESVRVAAMAKRDRHKRGADETNNKRWGVAKREVESESERHATRVATATATETVSFGSPGEGVGGDTPPPNQQQAAVALVLQAFTADGPPKPARVAAWISQLGSAEAVVEIVQKYPTKPADYIEKCVATAAREARDDNGTGGKNTRGRGPGRGSGEAPRAAKSARFRSPEYRPGGPDPTTGDVHPVPKTPAS